MADEKNKFWQAIKQLLPVLNTEKNVPAEIAQTNDTLSGGGLIPPNNPLPIVRPDVPLTNEGVTSQLPVLDDGNFQVRPGTFQQDYSKLNLPQIAPMTENAPPVMSSVMPTALPTPQSNIPVQPTTIQGKINAVNNKDYKERKTDELGNVIQEAGKDRDNDYDWKDALGGFLVGYSNGARNGDIGTGIQEGMSGVFDRNYVEKTRDRREIAQLLPQLEQENKQREFETGQQLKQTQQQAIQNKPKLEAEKRNEDQKNKIALEATKFENRMKIVDAQAEREGRQWERDISADGKVFKKYKDGRYEPLVNPTTGEQEIDPSKQFYDIYDPTTGQTVKANGGQILGYSGAIQQGNAQRTQQVNIQNSNQEFEAQKLNVQNTVNYNKQVVDQMRELAKSKGQIIENEGEINGISSEMETVQQQMNSVDTSTEEGAKRYNDLALKYGALNNKLETAIGKTTAGTEAVAQLASQNIKRPGQIKAVKVQPTIIKPRTVPKEKDPLGLFQ